MPIQTRVYRIAEECRADADGAIDSASVALADLYAKLCSARTSTTVSLSSVHKHDLLSSRNDTVDSFIFIIASRVQTMSSEPQSRPPTRCSGH